MEENLDMKINAWLIGVVTILAVSGCDWDEDHHHHRGGDYGGYYGEYPYHNYGHGEDRPYNHPYDHDRTGTDASPFTHSYRPFLLRA